MSFQLLLVVVAAAMFVALAAWRLFRVRAHRDPLDGVRQIIFVLVFLLVPPIVLQVLLAPKDVDAVGGVGLFVLLVVAIWVMEWIVGMVVARVAPANLRQTLLMALVGRDTSAFVPFDPPMTKAIAADVDAVDHANAAFPRGAAFMEQAGRPDFESTWQTLDSATRTLETDIDEQRRLRLGVAERALATAADARGRLDMLRRDAGPTSRGAAAG